jgi:hypothetical protein
MKAGPMNLMPEHLEAIRSFGRIAGMRNSMPTENRTEIGFLSGFLTGFLFAKSSSQSERTRCVNQKRKSGRGQKRGKGGSDPTLAGFQPLRNSWDRSRPFSNSLARVPQEQVAKAKGEDNVHH